MLWAFVVVAAVALVGIVVVAVVVVNDRHCPIWWWAEDRLHLALSTGMRTW
jgi:hypothetical protein